MALAGGLYGATDALTSFVNGQYKNSAVETAGNFGASPVLAMGIGFAVEGLGTAGKGTTLVAKELSWAAKSAARLLGAGKGAVYGTKMHTAFEAEVNVLGRANLFTERSYLNGAIVPRGTAGSVRVDVVYGPLEAPIAIFDLKTGGASLRSTRIKQIQAHIPGGCNVPVCEVRP